MRKETREMKDNFRKQFEDAKAQGKEACRL